MADQRRGTARSRPRPMAGSVDLPLAAYGLATGILAAGAGALVASAHRYLGSLAGATSLATIVAIAALASLATDAVLGWLLPLRRTGSSRHS